MEDDDSCHLADNLQTTDNIIINQRILSLKSTVINPKNNPLNLFVTT